MNSDPGVSVDGRGSLPAQAAGSAASPSILVVDDNPVNLKMIQTVLTAEGFRAHTAEDGPGAIAQAKRLQPDLILLDIVMPGESGFEVCGRLKSDLSTSDIPVIYLSALDDVKSKVTGLKLGAVDYISKPFHPEEILARVRVHLRIRATNRLVVERQQARLEQARSAQRAILTRPDELPGAAFAVFYHPLEEAGGDFYDVLEVDAQSHSYFVADVSGHGLSAAFPTFAIKALLRQYSGPLYSPEDTMRGVDSVMRPLLSEGQFITACYARLNKRTRRLAVISAGHPPLILVRSTGELEIADSMSDPLGVFGSVVLERRDFSVGKGDRIFLYTDGLVEATPGARKECEIAELARCCAEMRSVPLDQVAEKVVRHFWPDPDQAGDDLLLLAAEVRA